MFVLNQKDKTPIFNQIEKQIIEFIALGILKSDEQLPSVRSLANELGINPNTVAKAYNNLEAKGYVYTISGKGVFVSQSEIKEKIVEKKMIEFKRIVDECYKFGINKENLIAYIEEHWKGEQQC